MRDLTGHKITDRKRGATCHATKKWTANDAANREPFVCLAFFMNVTCSSRGG
jgi:hypothetical protein